MVSGYAQKFKMAEPSDNPCSSSSEGTVLCTTSVKMQILKEYGFIPHTLVYVRETLYINKHMSKVCFVRIESDFYDLG